MFAHGYMDWVFKFDGFHHYLQKIISRPGGPDLPIE
jgi:hypothetical protein